MKTLQAPFPYFGGKSKVSDIIWQILGQPKHYIEPFFGSGAVLLSRPDYQSTMVETVCDKDGYLANVWRALQFAPDGVARWCDWPVNHAELSARKIFMIKNENYLIENLAKNPEWYDAKLAGYWIWGASCWIGSGLTRIGQRHHISNAGVGVHKIGKIPHISNAGMGVHKIGQIPRIGNAGVGVHKIGKRPHIGDTIKGVQEPYNTNIYEWFRQLSERLRNVRVVCGDWTRVCGGNWQSKMGICGMFFDPPYGIDDRDTEIYHHDSTSIAADVMAWARARGNNPKFRIALAGYEEYDTLIEHGWNKYSWEAVGGYANTGKARGRNNRHRETLYFSPHCLPLNNQTKLF